MLGFLTVFVWITLTTNNFWTSSASSIPRHRHGWRRQGAISSETDLCSQIGANCLRDGGNAADALIATSFCTGVIAMYHSGIGGGGYMLVRSPRGAFETIDFKDVAPSAASEDMFVGNTNASLIGGLACAVPGQLRGLEYLHRRYAALPWARLIRPSIDLAEHGFIINKDLDHFIHMDDQAFLVQDPAWAVDFAPNGTLKGAGEVMTRKRYANTLRQISKTGADAFYHGSIASSTVKAIRAREGIMTEQDLASYKAASRKAIQISYRDYKITSDEVPAGGTQGLSILKTLEGYADMGDPSALNISVHHFAEAMRFSFGERSRLGDPIFNDTVGPFAEQLISGVAASKRRSQISDQHTLPPEAYNPDGYGNVQNTGTSGIVAHDSSGLTIAYTSTVNEFWGSHICVPESGIIVNNIMADFSQPNTKDLYGFPPAPANVIRPGKRPIGSMTNLIVEHAKNSSFVAAVASAGGSQIITANVQMLWHMLDRGLSAHAAIREPRFHDQVYPNTFLADWTFNNETTAFLQSRGHNVTFSRPTYTVIEIILQGPNAMLEAVSDPHLGSGGAYVV